MSTPTRATADSGSDDTPGSPGSRQPAPFLAPLLPLLPLARWLGRVALDALPALGAGVVASAAATALMLWLRLVAGIVTLPELVGERVLPTLDANTFIRLLIQFGKIRPLLYTLIGQFVLGVLVAPLYPYLRRWLARRLPVRLARGAWPGWPAWLAAAIYVLGMWLLALIIFWPVLAENTFGFPVGTARAAGGLCSRAGGKRLPVAAARVRGAAGGRSLRARSAPRLRGLALCRPSTVSRAAGPRRALRRGAPGTRHCALGACQRAHRVAERL